MIGKDGVDDAIFRLETAVSTKNTVAILRRLIRESLDSLYAYRTDRDKAKEPE